MVEKELEKRKAYIQRSLIFNHYLYTVKNSSGTINSNTMTKILKAKNPNPNIILTYNHVSLKNLIFMNAVFLKIIKEKAFKLI